jgi:hypothetical protein
MPQSCPKETSMVTAQNTDNDLYVAALRSDRPNVFGTRHRAPKSLVTQAAGRVAGSSRLYCRLCMPASRPTIWLMDMPVGSRQSLAQKRGQRLHLGTSGARGWSNEIQAADGHGPTR